MSTYQQEKAVRDAAEAKKAQVYRYEPAGFDIFDPKTTLRPGALVVKVQPYGCPKNGTMGQTYVGDSQTGTFIGMVALASLTKASR